jgi:hypothetical protein
VKLILIAALAFSASAFAQDKPFSVASFDVGDVLLFMDKGPCEGDAKLAQGKKKDGSTDTGCWVPNGPYIQVVWLDGAVDRVPVKAFKAPGGV